MPINAHTLSQLVRGEPTQAPSKPATSAGVSPSQPNRNSPTGTFAAIPGDYWPVDVRPPGPSVIPGTLTPLATEAPSTGLILVTAALFLLVID